MSTIALTLSTPSEAYKADISVAHDALSLISSCDGVLENHHGISMENMGFKVQLTTSGEAFRAILTNKELFDSIFKKMEVTRIGSIEQYHTNPVGDPKKALSGPLTEVYLVSLKNPTPENREAFESIAGRISKTIEGEKWTYGWNFADNNKAIIVAAWDSIEARQAREQEPDVAGSFKELMTLIDPYRGPFHVNLVKV